MIVAVGNFSFQDNEAMVTYFGQRRSYNARGRGQTLTRQMRVEGEMIGSSAAVLNDRLGEILSILSVDGFSAALLESDGTATHMQIGQGSFTGGRIVESHFPMQDGMAHFATAIPFGFTIEADYLVNDNDPLVAYSETLTQVGDGRPRSVVIEVDNGAPVEQTVSTHTPIYVIQQGEAVGILSYPVPNLPLFPNAIRAPEDIQISEGSPRLDNGAWFDYPVRWQYRFTLPTSIGIPHPTKR